MGGISEPRLQDAAGRPLGRPALGGFLYSAGDLFDAVIPPSDWGPWRLDTDVWVLYPVRPYRYEVDLEACLTSAAVLDRIMQVSGKTWADDAVIAGLIRALNDVLYPQSTLCSSGRSKRITKAQAREMARNAQAGRDRALALYQTEES